MPLTPAELQSPTGELEAFLFPGDTPSALTARLQKYLDEGYAKALPLAGTAADAAARAWAYHRAYLAVWLRLSSSPSSAALDGQGSTSFTTAQIDAFRVQSDAWLTQFEELTPAEEAPQPARVVAPQSRTVRHEIEW